MTPLAWTVLAVAVVVIVVTACVRAARQEHVSPEEAERLRRLGLGGGGAAAAADPDDWIARRMDELGWKGAIRAWLDELVHDDVEVSARASEALTTLAADDPDVVDDLVVLLDDDEPLAGAVQEVLAAIMPQARAKLEERAGEGGPGGERARELLDV